MTKYLVIYQPVGGIYQVDEDLFDSKEEAENIVFSQKGIFKGAIYKIIPIEI